MPHKTKANSACKSSSKKFKSDIDVDLISNMAESVLRDRHNRAKSIFLNNNGGSGLMGLVSHSRHRSSLASELGRDQSFSYIQNQIKNANVPVESLYEHEED